MAWGDVARIVAPTLATGLLGPFGGLVAKVAADALFPDEPDKKQTATPQEVVAKMATLNSPDDIARLKEAELAVKKFEAEHGIQLAQLDAASTAGARAMRISALASGNKTADSMSWLVMGSFLVIAALVLFGCALVLGGGIPYDQNRAQIWIAVSGLIRSILGYFSANALQVVSFYFGSSSGSAAKTDQLASMASDAVAAMGRIQATMPPAASPPTVTRTTTATGDTVTTATGRPSADALAARSGVHDIAFSPPGSEARWDACIAWILEREGRYSNDRADRGGPTNMGITQRTLANWRHKDVTPEDVQNLTIDEAKAIYRANYWNAARCGDMPAGVDLSVFDAGTMSGPAMGVEFAQFAAGLRDKSVDGVVGSQTLKALSNVDPQALIDGIASARLAFYQKTVDGDATQQANLPGWRNRAELTRVRAQELLRAWDRENGLVA